MEQRIFQPKSLKVYSSDAELGESPQVHSMRIIVAATAAERELGLSGVTELAPDQGLLMIQDGMAPIRIWTMGMLFPIDIVFIAHGGRVANIVEAAPPGSEQMYWSRGFVDGVLELAAGAARQIGLTAGSRIEWDPPPTA